MEHAFGRTAGFTLGMEEELLLVDPVDFRLAHVAAGVIGRVKPPPGAAIKHDVYEALVETASPIVDGADAGARALDALRAALREAGATLLGCGIHPNGAFGDVVHVTEERYEEIADTMRGLIRRTPTCALHVHVGMPDPETAIATYNRLRAHLPLLQALAAHSPWWYGRDSGFATARAQMFRGYPRAIIPRAFADWDDYVETVACWVQAGDLPDYTYLWWDIRPHPRLGTLEVRAMDAQALAGSAAGLSALVHALAVACAEGASERLLPAEALTESSFRAGRDGLDATLWWRGRLTPVREIAADALAIARPYAQELDGPLEEVERILSDGNGADRMRARFAEGGMTAMLAGLAAESATPYGATRATLPMRGRP